MNTKQQEEEKKEVPEVCPECDGTGEAYGHLCKDCGGKGYI
jgi:DnaJ-class molecular chaperone